MKLAAYIIDKAYCPVRDLRTRKVPSGLPARIRSASEREPSKYSHVFSSEWTSRSDSARSPKTKSVAAILPTEARIWLIWLCLIPFFFSHLQTKCFNNTCFQQTFFLTVKSLEKYFSLVKNGCCIVRIRRFSLPFHYLFRNRIFEFNRRCHLLIKSVSSFFGTWHFALLTLGIVISKIQRYQV